MMSYIQSFAPKAFLKWFPDQFYQIVKFTQAIVLGSLHFGNLNILNLDIGWDVDEGLASSRQDIKI